VVVVVIEVVVVVCCCDGTEGNGFADVGEAVVVGWWW
jgi:hypothetical protein